MRADLERQKPARARAGQIRFGMQNYIETLGVIAVARAENDHLTLGYDSWQAYVDAEFGEGRIKLPPELRRKAVEELRLAGASQREIGHTLGVGQTQVRRDLAEPYGSPAPKSALVEAIRGEIEGAAERAEDHQAATADRVGPAVASPEVPANTPGPAETSTAGATGVGTPPAPVADTQDPGVAAPADSEPSSSESGPFAAGGEREEAPGLTPTGVSSRSKDSQTDDLVDTPVGPMSPAVAAAIGADPNAAWRRKFFDAIVAARKVMRAEVEDVVRLADDEAVDELHRVARDLSSYSGRIAEKRAALHPNVTPIRRAK